MTVDMSTYRGQLPPEPPPPTPIIKKNPHRVVEAGDICNEYETVLMGLEGFDLKVYPKHMDAHYCKLAGLRRERPLKSRGG